MAVIIAAGGRGERSGAGIPKQFRDLAGVPMIERSVRPFVDAGHRPIVIAAPEEHLELTRSLFSSATEVEVVAGGTTRRDSVAAGLERVSSEYVLVHDAARPLVPANLIERTLAALARADAAIPGVQVDETLKQVEEGIVTRTVERSGLWTVQTPQGFRTELLRRAHVQAKDLVATDDAQLVERLGGTVEIVPGSRRNIKVTTGEDLDVAAALTESAPSSSSLRVGHGFDTHAFADGRHLVIGGVRVPHSRGLAGHSDADVLAHAIADAILGAAKLGDLGALFPADERWRDASSLDILRSAAQAARDRGWSVANVDATVVAEEPKLSGFTGEMAVRIADAIAASEGEVSVKATSTDGLGSTGRREGLAAHAVVLLRRLG